MIVVLSGGVGAARLLSGVLDVVEATDVTAIVNTGDDVVLHGLHISPDIDTITYTLSGAVNPDTGWGQRGETWQAMDALERFVPVRPDGSGAAATWFRLGDRDLATHLYRTHRLAEGAPLSTVTAEITRAFGLDLTMLPVTDDRLETRVTTAAGEIGFQEYFVGQRHSVAVSAVRFAGAEHAKPGPGVLEALHDAEVIIIAPSNPLVSIGPLLAVPGVRDAIVARRRDVVAVSPIIAGAALKGPADRMLSELGHDSSALGVARLYAPLASTLVIDEADRALSTGIASAGIEAVVAETIMRTPAIAAELARVVLAAARSAR
ncbi:MAG: 2-phospho-L-lactate transferase [Acidimicrobiia bacterium]